MYLVINKTLKRHKIFKQERKIEAIRIIGLLSLNHIVIVLSLNLHLVKVEG
jgi:hypothetical protein